MEKFIKWTFFHEKQYAVLNTEKYYTFDTDKKDKTSVADPGCLSQIPDPDFYQP